MAHHLTSSQGPKRDTYPTNNKKGNLFVDGDPPILEKRAHCGRTRSTEGFYIIRGANPHRVTFQKAHECPGSPSMVASDINSLVSVWRQRYRYVIIIYTILDCLLQEHWKLLIILIRRWKERRWWCDIVTESHREWLLCENFNDIDVLVIPNQTLPLFQCSWDKTWNTEITGTVYVWRLKLSWISSQI